jgi:hypothetical protein
MTKPEKYYNRPEKMVSQLRITKWFKPNKKSVGMYSQTGLSWSWLYGSWIYNYLCNQCLSPLMLRVWISIRARCTPLCDKVCQWLATGLIDFVLGLYVITDRWRGRCDHMVNWFTTTYAISGYHHWCCEFESRSGRGVQHYVIKFVSDLRQVGGFLRVLWFPLPIKLTATI